MKTFQLLAALTKEELKLLRRAVLSPLYNTNLKVIHLFEILRPSHPHFDTTLKGQQKIYKKLFPKAVFNESKLQWHYTRLTKIIEHLLLYISQEKNSIERQKRLIGTYRERNLEELFFRGNKNLLMELNSITPPNVTNYLQKFQLGSSRYFHPSFNRLNHLDPTLRGAMENLDCFFMIEKMRLTLAIKSEEQISQKKHTIYFLESIKKIRATPFAKNNQLLQLYCDAFILLDKSKKANFETFETFETIIFKNIYTFESFDLQLLFFTGLNYIAKMRNAGAISFKERTLKWYQFGLSSKLLFTNDKMEEAIFANLVISGCENNAYEWTKGFIETYRDTLITENLEETIQYYYGLVYYSEGDLDRSLDYLIACGKKSVFPPRKRAVLIRALFEKYLMDKSYKDLLLSSLISYKALLRINKKLPKERLQHYTNFIKIMQQLTRKVDKKDAPASIKQWLEESISNNLPVLAKRWIIEKVNSL